MLQTWNARWRPAPEDPPNNPPLKNGKPPRNQLAGEKPAPTAAKMEPGRNENLGENSPKGELGLAQAPNRRGIRRMKTTCAPSANNETLNSENVK